MSDKATNLSPTFAEMAERMRSKSRILRYKASQSGENTPKGRLALADAAQYDAIAADLAENQREALAARDGLLTEYRKARANA